jgi:predicted neuraminidase
MLAFNPVSRNWGPRMPLRLALSTDNGESWVAYLDLEHDKGSFAYPAIVPWRSAAGHPGFALTYTINRRNIRFLAMTMDQFHSLATPAAAYEPQFFV